MRRSLLYWKSLTEKVNGMNNYDFSTLNDKEFEQLCRDLLNAEFGMDLQNFATGRDGGIDLRSSTPKSNNTIVVQAKHYLGSGYNQLKYVLKKEELPKVKRLTPEKYIIVTSVSLLPQHKDELKALLHPFVISASDIIGKEDLNAYLGKHPEIEKRHFKLWFSSTSVMEAVLNNAVEGRSRALMERIRLKVPLYVVTEKLGIAMAKLHDRKMLVITGQPGIGKTTLAEIMLVERAREGNKIYKVYNVREAEDVISPDPDEKQVFYFDDFLGANYLELIHSRNSPSELTDFVDRILSTPNKYLLMTTRTVVRNQAAVLYETIGRSILSKEDFEIQLSDYSTIDKAKILYNHLFFSIISKELRERITQDRFYLKIIRHKNYTPRIIEFITSNEQTLNLDVAKYRDFIIDNLNDPKEIWKKSFTNQIEYLDQVFLMTLFSFVQPPNENQLQQAFAARLKYEREENNHVIRADQFENSINRLLYGFIICEYDAGKKIKSYRFINPSLTDFLIAYISASIPLMSAILSAAIFFEQIERFDPKAARGTVEKQLQQVVGKKIINNDLEFIYRSSRKQQLYETMTSIEALIRFCTEVDTDWGICEFLKRIEMTSAYRYIGDDLIDIMLKVSNMSLSRSFILEHFDSWICLIIEVTESMDYAERIPVLFKLYDRDYDLFIETDDGYNLITNMIDNILDICEQGIKDSLESKVDDIEEVNSEYSALENVGELLVDSLLSDCVPIHHINIHFDKQFWEECVRENTYKKIRDDGYEHYDKELYYMNRNPTKLGQGSIDDLFDS
jgi:hypothetical protein